MAKHPGDPRSDVLGEQQYDESEYPYNTYTPPEAPPSQGNAQNFIPYRGQALHGQQITRNTDHDTGSLPYLEEQRAQDKYTDPTITPRDLSNVPPIRVQVVTSPDLLFKRKAQAASFAFTNDGIFRNVLQANNFRKRAVISVRADTAGPVFFAPQGDVTTAQAATAYARPEGIELLDSVYTGALFVMVPTTSSPAVFSVWQEYEDTDGDSLL